VIETVPVGGDRLKTFRISDKIVEFIKEQKRDYRVCTSCGGAILLPTAIKRPKPNDIKIPVGENYLYVSAMQARYIDEIDDSMLMTYLY
jgi:hypothetical protein